MDASLLVARLVLAGVFALAALAKLADRAGSRRALIDFGVPAALAPPVAVLLPLAEVAIAAALVAVASAWWSALGALTLLFLFTAAIGVHLARGRNPNCGCFGRLFSAPTGPGSLVRNGLLGTGAGFVVWQGRHDPGPSVVSWLGGLSPTETLVLLVGLVVLGVLAIEGWAVIQLLGQNGRLLARLEALEAKVGIDRDQTAPQVAEALPLGSRAPDFTLPDLDGRKRGLDEFLGKPRVIVFFSPQCGFCRQMAPSIGQLPDRGASLLLVSNGDPEEHRRMAAKHGWQCDVLLQREWEVSTAYRANGTPTGYLLDAEACIASELAIGVDLLLRLAPTSPSTAGSNGHDQGLTAGTPPGRPRPRPGRAA